MRTYRLTPAGRRLCLALLVGALLIWVFALWSFSSTLRISYNPLAFLTSLRDSLAAGIGVAEVVPALLMLALIVATPLLIWSLLEEWSAAYTPTPEGLRFESLGVALTYPWPVVQAVRPADDDGDEPLDELLLATDQTGQIASPLVRLLHRQAYGRTRLPIYPGLESRDDLIAEIRRAIVAPAPASAARAAESAAP
jgi:hypothetical protein